MLKLKLFGTAEAHYSGQVLPGFPKQQAHLLLCYLLLNRQRPQPRERLAAVFWGDYPTDVSRKYLRNSIWRVRRLLQSVGAPPHEYLAIHADSISFRPSSRFWLDVEAFEKKVIAFQNISGRQLTSEQASELEEVVELYSGDLLDGIYEDWCLYERERLSLLHLNALSQLMVFHEFNGSYERGLAHGERILAHDNTREKVHRQMMRLYYLADDRDAALAQYKRCSQILRETLDTPPMEATTRLYQQMLHDQGRSSDWQQSGDVSRPSTTIADESLQEISEYALRKIHCLQAIIEEASIELRHLENLISNSLLNSKQRRDS